MRNITNVNNILSSRSIDNGGDLNQLTADLPLNLVLDDTTNDSINLGGLNSYGGSGKIIKVNSNNDGLEYANETDTVHTAQTPIVIINGVIGLNGIAGYGSSIGQRLLIRTNANNTALEYFPQPDFITGVTSPLAISNTGVISLSGLSNFGGAGKIIKVNSSNNGFEYSNEQDISGFITASSTDTLTNKSMTYGQLTLRPFDIYYNASVMTANYLSVFKSVSNRCILFSNSNLNYRHGIKHNDSNLEFYISTTNDGVSGTNLIYDISSSGLKLNKCDTVATGNLLINSSGMTKKSVESFTLPTSTG